MRNVRAQLPSRGDQRRAQRTARDRPRCLRTVRAVRAVVSERGDPRPGPQPGRPRSERPVDAPRVQPRLRRVLAVRHQLPQALLGNRRSQVHRRHFHPRSPGAPRRLHRVRVVRKRMPDRRGEIAGKRQAGPMARNVGRKAHESSTRSMVSRISDGVRYARFSASTRSSSSPTR